MGVGKDYAITRVGDPALDWLYQETLFPPCELWIAGSGHVARAVASLADKVDFQVSVFDDRPDWAEPRAFPPGTRLRVDAWERLAREPLPASAVFGLVVTRGHQHDALILSHWIQREFVFLGMIGSRRKARTICDELLAESIATAEQLARVACPVGLAIEAETVDEIAVSVLAQYIQKRAEWKRARVQPRTTAAGSERSR